MKYLEYLETHIINKCNLNCKGCSHFSNIVDEEDAIVDIDVFERDFARLGELFDHIFTIRLMGGEPFLNPNIGKYIEIVRKYFPQTDLRILTNGILIPNIVDYVLKDIADYGVILDISCYPVTDKIRDEIEKKLNSYGIKSKFSELTTDFHKRLNVQGDHDIREMYSSCPSKRCTFVSNGKLAICPAPFMSRFLNKRFGTGIDVESDLLDLYKPELSAEYIRDYLKRPMKSCGYCSEPEEFKWECGKTPMLEDWLVEESLERYNYGL